jgi:hypothetical protein
MCLRFLDAFVLCAFSSHLVISISLVFSSFYTRTHKILIIVLESARPL